MPCPKGKPNTFLQPSQQLLAALTVSSRRAPETRAVGVCHPAALRCMAWVGVGSQTPQVVCAVPNSTEQEASPYLYYGHLLCAVCPYRAANPCLTKQQASSQHPLGVR